MKIERIWYGMFGDGKIYNLKSDGVNALVPDSVQQRLREITLNDSDKFLYFQDEHIVVLPHVKQVHDAKARGGREGIRAQFLIMPFWDYLRFTKPLMTQQFLPDSDTVPDKLDSAEV